MSHDVRDTILKVMVCPTCKSLNVVKSGFTTRADKKARRVWRCEDCGHLFVLREGDTLTEKGEQG